MWLKSPAICKSVLVSVAFAGSPSLGLATQTPAVASLCERVDVMYRQYGWGVSPCRSLPWTTDRSSENGNPLLQISLGESKQPRHTTLVMAGIHGDEPTTVFIALSLAKELLDHGLGDKSLRVVIAPIVNPDGFLVRKRNNANGVDLNRNFPTKDWPTGAMKLWVERRKKSPAHFPGNKPASEQGTLFQMGLLESLSPDKIISIHSPLGFVDYDGPGDSKQAASLSPQESRALQIARVLAGKAKKRVVDYPFFPGSLGNYAGNERHIPTITLEVGSSSPASAQTQWKVYKDSLREAVEFEFHRVSLAQSETDGAPSQKR